jgi:hypothetical protein
LVAATLSEEGKIERVIAVDTCLIVDVNARPPNSRGVMEDWKDAVDDLSKDDVLPVKEIARCGRDEELQSVELRRNTRVMDEALARRRQTYLATVRVGTRVGLFSDEIAKCNRNAYSCFCAHHRQKSWTGMFHLEILVLDIDGVVSGRDKALCR